MAYIFFGADFYATGHVQTGDWNTVGNWFSDLGLLPSSKSSGVPATPLGRLPTVADYCSIRDIGITTAPSTQPWSGHVDSYYTGNFLTTGSWSGLISCYQGIITGGTYSGTLAGGIIRISGGTFNCDF